MAMSMCIIYIHIHTKLQNDTVLENTGNITVIQQHSWVIELKLFGITDQVYQIHYKIILATQNEQNVSNCRTKCQTWLGGGSGSDVVVNCSTIWSILSLFKSMLISYIIMCFILVNSNTADITIKLKQQGLTEREIETVLSLTQHFTKGSNTCSNNKQQEQ